jgi:hypothetical protein
MREMATLGLTNAPSIGKVALLSRRGDARYVLTLAVGIVAELARTPFESVAAIPRTAAPEHNRTGQKPWSQP